MPTLETQRVAADNRALVRKIQKAVAFLAPMTVVVPDTIFAPDGTLIDLQTEGWLPIGMVSPDGYTFGRDVSKEEISALGYASPVRSDPTSVARSVSFTPIESHKRILKELQLGQDLSAVTQDTVTGEFVIDHVDLPVGAEYRLLVLGSDGPAAENWISGRLYPSTKLGTTGEEAWGNEGAVSQQLTMDVFTDADLGTPCREFVGGTGAKAAALDLGYTQAPVGP